MIESFAIDFKKLPKFTKKMYKKNRENLSKKVDEGNFRKESFTTALVSDACSQLFSTVQLATLKTFLLKPQNQEGHWEVAFQKYPTDRCTKTLRRELSCFSMKKTSKSSNF